MREPRSPWVAGQAAHFDRLITEQRAAYEGDTWWDYTRDAFVAWMLPHVPSGAVVFDIGCGDGYYAARLGATDRVARVIAIDASPAVIAYARVRRTTPRVTFLCTALEEWEPETSADVVVLSEALEHFADSEAAMRTIVQLLRPGGIVAVSTPNRLRLENLVRRTLGKPPVLVDATHAREFTLRELEELGMRCGLRTIARRTVTAWAEWACAPLRACRWVPGVAVVLASDMARGRTRSSYVLGEYCTPFGHEAQMIFRRM